MKRTRGISILLSTMACITVASAASATQLSQVTTKANHIIALNRLELTTEQIAAIVPGATLLVANVKARQAARDELLAGAANDLATARWRLMGGDPLEADLQARLDKLEAALQTTDDDLYEAAVEIMEDIEDEFTNRQSAFIDWTPPRGEATNSREPMLQRAQRQRDHAAMVMMGERFLHSIRYFPLEQYILQAQKLVDDFLRPLIDPRSADYRSAQQYMFKLVEEVRLLGEPDWQDQGAAYAEQMIMDLGLEQPLIQDDAEKPYDWNDMYVIFSDLAAPELLTSMRAARVR